MKSAPQSFHRESQRRVNSSSEDGSQDSLLIPNGGSVMTVWHATTF
jgi:hypothetical protein